MVMGLTMFGIISGIVGLSIGVPHMFSSYHHMKQAEQNKAAANNALVADCQNIYNDTLNLAKVTTHSDPTLTNAVAQYNKDCAKITGPFDTQNMIATNNAVVTDCQNLKTTTENLSRVAPSNDPNMVSALSQYSADCSHLSGPLYMPPTGSDEMTLPCENEKAAIMNLAGYTTLNDPNLVNGLEEYNRDCTQITGPLYLP